MKVKSKLCVVSILFMFAGCVSAVDNTVSSVDKSVVSAVDRGAASLTRAKLPVSTALKGTNTAVVGIAIDKDGMPLETVREIVLKPGQRAIFAGPDDFQIIFKDKKIPEKKTLYRSANGVVTVDVPKDILDRPEFREEFAKTKQVRFNYAIRIKDRELDPPFIIKRDD
ncbi:hypothetical protein [Cellvibrio mixtus]|uniref:hypothetical protein n=1 Tax=Cellvibrio mixtus TaxID=39650 RepID=UPI000693490D|nr:hypothetical protein [Cellvibrio mixtus]